LLRGEHRPAPVAAAMFTRVAIATEFLVDLADWPSGRVRGFGPPGVRKRKQRPTHRIRYVLADRRGGQAPSILRFPQLMYFPGPYAVNPFTIVPPNSKAFRR
jgi:hypothetical protein